MYTTNTSCYYIIDDTTAAYATLDFVALDATNDADALRKAADAWTALSRSDRRKRDAYTLCYGPVDEDGTPDGDCDEVIAEFADLDDDEVDMVRSWDQTVALMDDDLRESVHAELAPCGVDKFLRAYMARHLDKFGEEFAI